MSDHRTEIEAFFAVYARITNDALQSPPVEDIDALVAAFAPFFVGASPAGVMGGANDAQFRAMIPEGWRHYRDVGGTAMRIDKLEVTELDPLHACARVEWVFDYRRPRDGKAGSVAFSNIYLVSFADGGPKIFAYITPDEQQAMKDHGLI